MGDKDFKSKMNEWKSGYKESPEKLETEVEKIVREFYERQKAQETQKMNQWKNTQNKEKEQQSKKEIDVQIAKRAEEITSRQRVIDEIKKQAEKQGDDR